MKELKLLIVAALALVDSLNATVIRGLNRLGLVAFANLYSQFTYDASLVLRAASLIAATATEAGSLNVGSGLVCGNLVIDVTAIETDTNDESYRIMVQGSPDAAFTAGTIAVLSDVCLGASGSVAKTLGLQGFSDTAGRYVVPFRNEHNGVTYPYLRIRTVIVGTIVTGINYSAWLAKD